MRRLLRSTLFWTLLAAVLSAGSMLIFMRATNFGQTANNNGAPALTWAVLSNIGFTPPVIVAVLLWGLFSVYWSVAARGAADPRQAESAWSRGLHVGLTTLAQALVTIPVPVPGLRARFLPAAPWLTAAGFAVMAAGLGLAVWARQTLGRHWSGAIATNAGHELVRGGPYRWVRHPIYTALLGLYLGTALVSGEWHALLGVVIAILAYWRKIRLEEAHLRGLFGAEYEAYARETRALIPRVF